MRPQFDFLNIMDHVRRTRERVYENADAPPHIEKLGVELILGSARFQDPHTIEIQERGGVWRRLTSRSSSSDRQPAQDRQLFRTSTDERDDLRVRVATEELLIMGAGPAGIEMAQAFQRLGSEVMVVASGNRILPRDDPEHAGQLQRCLSREGVSFLFGQKVTKLERRENSVAAVLDDGRTILCEAALAALGREPAIHGLQLEMPWFGSARRASMSISTAGLHRGTFTQPAMSREDTVHTHG